MSTGTRSAAHTKALLPGRRVVAEAIQRFGLVFIWGCVILTFSVLRPSEYFTGANFDAMFSSQSVLLVVAVASLPPLVAGELDLSVGGVTGISLVLTGWLNVQHGVPIGASILIALAAGCVIGAINAFVVIVVGVDSIVTTLGMGTLLGGAALGIDQLPLSGVSQDFVNAMRSPFLGLDVVFYLALGTCLVMWFVLEYTPLGRRLYFVGAGSDVARLSGIRVAWMRAGALIASAGLSALAGVLEAGILGGTDPTVGPTFLLPALAAAFLGATAIKLGRFNAWGTFVAVYFLVSGITGLELVGVAGWISQVFYGGALVVAVVASRLVGRQVLRGLNTRGAERTVRKDGDQDDTE